MSRLMVFAGAAAAALGLAPAALAPSALAQTAAHPARSPFDAAVVFGDSLSDDGNIALSAGLPRMRFTTNPGTVTVENVASAFDLPLSPSVQGGPDYAWGGAGVTTNAPGTPAGVPTETTQISGYLAAHPSLDRRTLYTVFAGANDIFAAATALFTGRTTSAAATATIAAAGTQEGALVGRMQAAGAKYIVVFNLPDIGLTPQSLGLDAFIPTAGAQLTALSATYNTALNAAIATNGRSVIPVNTFALLREVVADPAASGFTNVTSPACTTASALNCTPATLVAANAASTYLFADGVHPTTAAHAIFGQAVIAEIAAPSYISLLAEAPLQTSSAQRDAWRGELVSEATQATSTRVFGRLDYDSQTYDAAGYTGRAGDDGGVATLGIDGRIAPGATLGLVFSAGQSFARFDDGAAKFHAQSYLLSVFGRRTVLEHGYVDGALGFAALNFSDIARSFALGPSQRTERGSTEGAQVTATLGGGWWFGGEAFRLGPYAEAQYEHVHVGGYAEDGSDATAMTFGRQTREALVGELGLRLRGAWRSGLGRLSPYADLAYDYDGRAETRYVDGGLVTLPGTFDVPGYAAARSWGVARVGVEAQFASGWSASIGYRGRFADSSQTVNGVTLGARRAF